MPEKISPEQRVKRRQCTRQISGQAADHLKNIGLALMDLPTKELAQWFQAFDIEVPSSILDGVPLIQWDPEMLAKARRPKVMGQLLNDIAMTMIAFNHYENTPR